MTTAERIRALREDADLSQTEVAKIINSAQTTYSDYETGKVRIPIDTLIILAKYYNVDVNYISGVTNKKMIFPS